MPDSTLDLSTLPFPPIELEDGELPDGAILIVRSHLDGNRSRLVTRTTEGLDWITGRGMIEVARDCTIKVSASIPNEEEDEGYGA